MLRNRLLILVGGCLLTVSGAWADDVGYVDCSGHADEIQVFAKARKTPDVIATLPCGERFSVLLYGFIFSRVQTRDGRVGYVYSNLISVDRSGGAVLQPASSRTPVPRTNPAPTHTAVAQPKPGAPPQPKPAAAQPDQEEVTLTKAPAPASAPTATSSAPVTSEPVAQPAPAPQTQTGPAAAQPTPAQPAPALPTPVTSAPAAEPPAKVTETAPTAAPPSAATESPAQPAAVEPAAPAVRDAASLRTSWERPNPDARRRTAPIELFGGYAYSRTVGNGNPAANMNGAMGSFGWNARSWLQIVAESSYNFATVNGTKNVLYGNHYGPRYFYRRRNRWALTPFAEALFGGSRADTTVRGTGGYSTSDNTLSYKVGGGMDIRPSRYLEIRLFDVDFYRTSFGTNLHQNNYWATTGIVLRLFGGGAE